MTKEILSTNSTSKSGKFTLTRYTNARDLLSTNSDAGAIITLQDMFIVRHVDANTTVVVACVWDGDGVVSNKLKCFRDLREWHNHSFPDAELKDEIIDPVEASLRSLSGYSP